LSTRAQFHPTRKTGLKYLAQNGLKQFMLYMGLAQTNLLPPLYTVIDFDFIS
jgi:hypothetical protein